MSSNEHNSVHSHHEAETIKRTLVGDQNIGEDLIRRCKTLSDITQAAIEDRATSMFEVVELLLDAFHKHSPNSEEESVFLKTIEEICIDKKWQKVSQQYLHIVISAVRFSKHEHSDKITNLLTKIQNNDKLSTNQDNVIINRDRLITVTEDIEFKAVYKFQHPGTGTCTESDSTCGFILRGYIEDDNSKLELCTKSEDYTDTGIHFHDIITANEMYWYVVCSSETSGHSENSETSESSESSAGEISADSKIRVAGGWNWWDKWFPSITDWWCEQAYIAYNVTGYQQD